MKIALIGYGGMGRALAHAARARGHEISAVIDSTAPEATASSVGAGAFNGADIAIDFSSAEGVLDSTKACIEAGVPLVVGTTGWYDRVEEVRTLIEKSPQRIGFLWSSNFSVGVHLYFRIIKEAARLANNLEEYDIWGHEIHHAGKADSPSGTAKTLEKILLDALERKDSVVEDRLDRKRKDSEIHFSSVRGGPVNFGHTIGFDSAADRILITHEARSRDGYSLGAVKAAEWLIGKTGFYDMNDYMRALLPDS
ncbi:MAG: 4-hydroxy-tetrahydrodipicolinate reductase [Patescibacteria group bacterium]|nr:4-hydroxy-tetrahydrodipicolinate reductase [Patescibacteria group bacterium]